MASSPDGIYEKGIIDPGYPVKNSTKPFWLTEPSPISTLQSPWPTSPVDVVIIGSGMTAASLSRTLYASKPDLNIVLVEARDLCSGATGRNGGHIKAMSPGAWFDHKEQFGVEEAIRIVNYEHSHLQEMTAAIKENGIDCDLDLVEGLDLYLDPHVFQRAVRAVEEMRKLVPELGARFTIYTKKEDLKDRSCPEGTVGAIGMPAASMWPYKMVTGLHAKHVKQNGLSIQTNTLVTDIEDKDSAEYATVKTSRGDIQARHIVHATNAWIGRLVPELREFVSPVRANVQRQLPSPASKKPKKNSWWIRYGEHDYEYMIQRHDGAYVMGRAGTGRRATADDSEKDFLAQLHLQAMTPRVFDFGAKDINTTHAWSGAVAFTEDGSPFIGRLPFAGRKHQWVCAAYQGIGMVRAFRSAQTLGLLILNKPLPSAFPTSMLLTDKRVRSLKGYPQSKL